MQPHIKGCQELSQVTRKYSFQNSKYLSNRRTPEIVQVKAVHPNVGEAMAWLSVIEEHHCAETTPWTVIAQGGLRRDHSQTTLRCAMPKFKVIRLRPVVHSAMEMLEW